MLEEINKYNLISDAFLSFWLPGESIRPADLPVCSVVPSDAGHAHLLQQVLLRVVVSENILRDVLVRNSEGYLVGDRVVSVHISVLLWLRLLRDDWLLSDHETALEPVVRLSDFLVGLEQRHRVTREVVLGGILKSRLCVLLLRRLECLNIGHVLRLKLVFVGLPVVWVLQGFHDFKAEFVSVLPRWKLADLRAPANLHRVKSRVDVLERLQIELIQGLILPIHPLDILLHLALLLILLVQKLLVFDLLLQLFASFILLPLLKICQVFQPFFDLLFLFNFFQLPLVGLLLYLIHNLVSGPFQLRLLLVNAVQLILCSSSLVFAAVFVDDFFQLSLSLQQWLQNIFVVLQL